MATKTASSTVNPRYPIPLEGPKSKKWDLVLDTNYVIHDTRLPKCWYDIAY